ncbi:E3 ubiquitin-protein ligase RZFP34, partial [Mucuna pruriens]
MACRRVIGLVSKANMEPQLSSNGLSLQHPLVDGSPSEFGCGYYGCSHYKRRCKIIAPCCNEIFDCRHCHNESKNSIEVNPIDRHDVPRHEVKRVVCSLCSTEQDVSVILPVKVYSRGRHRIRVQQMCIHCGVCMGRYFCSKCKFFDDDVSKNQYHCDECGICRTGGKENFFHCNKCGCCYSSILKDSHNCIEKAMHHNCAVCFEFLFDTTKDITVLPCGHTIHLECVKQMEQHLRYACPVCSKSFCDMSHVWEKLDEEVASMPMPEIYQNKMVWILCNDCGKTTEVSFHIAAHKCLKCKSYNTRKTQAPPVSCSSRMEEMVR